MITHQKRTMEVADALYGVSMQGDGVSKVISQRLRETVREPSRSRLTDPALARHVLRSRRGTRHRIASRTRSWPPLQAFGSTWWERPGPATLKGPPPARDAGGPRSSR